MSRVLGTLIFLVLVKTSLQECGHMLEKSVMCTFDPESETIRTFDLKLCTHCLLDAGHVCDGDACSYQTSPELLDSLIKWVLPIFPEKVGIIFSVTKAAAQFLIPSESRRSNTINGVIKLMEEKGLSFVHLTMSLSLDSPDEKHNYTLFVKEWREKLGARGFRLGQQLATRRGNIVNNFNQSEVSQLVDYFALVPFQRTLENYMQPFAPLTTYYGKAEGSTEYWLEKAVQLVRPECVMIDLGPRFQLHRSVEVYVQPGPGTKSTILETGKLDISRVCKQRVRGGVCQDYWEQESSTPWTVCSNFYYTYDNARSLRLKAELVKHYNVSGIQVWTSDITAGNHCSKDDPMENIRAVQIIREE